MKVADEIYIDHELRIRLLEDISSKIDKRFESIDRKFDHIDGKFDKLDSKITTLFLWTLGIMITLFGGIILHSVKLI